MQTSIKMVMSVCNVLAACALVSVVHSAAKKSACTLPSNPTTWQIIEYRKCLVDELGDTSTGGRWGRSVVTAEQERQNAIKEKQSAKLEAILMGEPDNKRRSSSLSQTVGTRAAKTKIPESILCHGLSRKQCDKRMKEYDEWRRANGVGVNDGRWGRSADYDYHDHSMEALVAQYRQWRRKYGYGRHVGRWGRSADGTRSPKTSENSVQQPSPRRVKRLSDFFRRSSSPDIYQSYELLKKYQEWRNIYGYGRKSGRWGR